MKNIDKIMTLILAITVIIIIVTVWKTANNNPLSNNNKEFVDNFIFEPPLKKVTVNYLNPIKGDLIVRKDNSYVGKKISLGEYNFYLRGNVTSVTYDFEFPQELLEKNDVNPDTIELYTILDDELVKAGGEKENNTIILTTTKLVPLVILADPNEVEAISEEQIYYNSRSKASILYEKMVLLMKNPKNTIIFGFIGIGIMMTLLLVTIERNRLPKKATNKNIQEYIDHVRSEGLSDREIIAELVERGIKVSHAEMLVRKK